MGNIFNLISETGIELYKDTYREIIIIDEESPNEKYVNEAINKLFTTKLQKNNGLFINITVETHNENNYVVTVTDTEKIMYDYKYFYDKLNIFYKNYYLASSGQKGECITFIKK
jgi:hypothetical protein